MITEENLINKINQVAMDSAELALELYNKPHEITFKKDKSVATEADKAIEKLIFEKLNGVLKDAYFIGEEGSETHSYEDKQKELIEAFKHEYVWAIDPIDGTDNFTAGSGEFAVSIGLLRKHNDKLVPYLGSVVLPKSKQLYYTDSKKSYISFNNNVQVLQKQTIMGDDNKPLSFLGFAANESELAKIDVSRLPNIRVPGSTVVQLINTAIGGYYGTRTGAHIWDIAAALAIARPLGMGVYEQFTGKIVDEFDINTFTFGNPKIDWRLKEPLFVCAPECKEFIMTNYVLKK